VFSALGQVDLNEARHDLSHAVFFGFRVIKIPCISWFESC